MSRLAADASPAGALAKQNQILSWPVNEPQYSAIAEAVHLMRNQMLPLFGARNICRATANLAFACRRLSRVTLGVFRLGVGRACGL